MDAGYGCNTQLRAGISALALCYVAGILPHTACGHRVGSRCRRKRGLAAGDHLSSSVGTTGINRSRSRQLAVGLPKRAWRTITWREGTTDALSSRFARVRVRAAHRDYNLTESRPEEWLLIEWPRGEKEPTKYWLSTLAARHLLPPAGRSRQIALAHRARLSGTQAGVWARTLRGTRMARLPPSRHAVHRRLRFPDLRAGDDSPLRPNAPPRSFAKVAVPEGYRPRGAAIAA